MIKDYAMVLRCVYCGKPAQEEWRSCCGEVHFEQVPECPECGHDLHPVQRDVTGIETYTMQCENCNFRSLPE